MVKVPCVSQTGGRFDFQNLAIEHATPVTGKLEPVAYIGTEIILHQPFSDQVWLGQSPSQLFWRMREFTLDKICQGFTVSRSHHLSS
ncbi:hypothetical protein GCM10011499_31670 [Pelagibacterium lentulum]|uniref:Uncharacterized protein n=1 Tax=Pelagibacterium lentulum TaxID=2029865 RepID=A0A916RJ44_9HYPH|nr:hypothetical protein GCM10011499_31670 [Pelagibacterium lentulum]